MHNNIIITLYEEDVLMELIEFAAPKNNAALKEIFGRESQEVKHCPRAYKSINKNKIKT
ncbi:MAG: hypothetical protein JSV88_27200 [Candidatus Aminicenantes bacterium]|nr:MAG: hypothetical protein JSV88_27200 [Candidatus Aminicenantes bacterium]